MAILNARGKNFEEYLKNTTKATYETIVSGGGDYSQGRLSILKEVSRFFDLEFALDVVKKTHEGVKA